MIQPVEWKVKIKVFYSILCGLVSFGLKLLESMCLIQCGKVHDRQGIGLQAPGNVTPTFPFSGKTATRCEPQQSKGFVLSQPPLCCLCKKIQILPQKWDAKVR